MFHRNRYTQAAKIEDNRPLADLTRILSAEQLADDDKRRMLLKNIRSSMALAPERFDSIALSLHHNILNHCQSLPDTLYNYYAYSGGLFDHILNRTEAALSLFRQVVLSQDASEFSEAQLLWQYALFSAAMLQGLGKLFIDYEVNLFDHKGKALKTWNSLLDIMGDTGTHYDYEFLIPHDHELRKRLNILLARLLMPASGYAWIASNPEVLTVWLALLNEDVRGAGTLGAILVNADAIAIRRYLNEFALKASNKATGGRYGRVATFVGGVPESQADKELQIGIEFMQWLSKALESGALMMNKAPLISVPAGMVMCAEVYRLFVREHPEYKNWQAVQKGFLALGLHATDSKGVINEYKERSTESSPNDGYILEQYAVALGDKNFIQTPEGTNVRSAIEIIHNKAQGSDKPLEVLSAAGQWQLPLEQETAPQPNSGFK